MFERFLYVAEFYNKNWNEICRQIYDMEVLWLEPLQNGLA